MLGLAWSATTWVINFLSAENGRITSRQLYQWLQYIYMVVTQILHKMFIILSEISFVLWYLVRWIGGQRDSYSRGGSVTTDRYRHWYRGWTSSQDQQYQLDGSSTTIRTENWNSDKNIRNRREFCTVRVMSTPENSCFHRNQEIYQ